MKNVLLLVHDDEGQEARLQSALDLTRALDGHLSCIDVSVYPVMTGDPYYTGTSEGMLLAEERMREGKNKAALEARLAHEDVPWDWADVIGNLADSICEASTLADIVVLNSKLEQFPYPDMRAITSRILTHARTPVLAVPDDRRGFVAKRAMVAWDGQASCASTLRACVPLLKLAQTVEILTVSDGETKVEPTEAAQYLSRHGIHASIRIIEDKLTDPDKIITDTAHTFHADYVLMGAYTHGRLMETFGGVTKRMLSQAKVPLVLGH